MSATVGLLHPGEMGAALGAALRTTGQSVLWASEGRSEATVARAGSARLEDAGDVAGLARRCDVIVSVCPPHAAADVAQSVVGFKGTFVDANAISPSASRAIGASFARYVDGGIIGPPPEEHGSTRLYLSGEEAGTIAALFQGSAVDARVLSPSVGDASALKMVYAAWTKGTAALLLAIQDVARTLGVEDALVTEWHESLPDLPERSARSATSAAAKGWRWIGEMEEIASTFSAAGAPDGFHCAAAEVYRRSR